MNEKEIIKDKLPEKVLPAEKPVEKKEATVKLFKNHFHNGIYHVAGSEIKVDETSLRFIEEHKIGKRV